MLRQENIDHRIVIMRLHERVQNLYINIFSLKFLEKMKTRRLEANISPWMMVRRKRRKIW